MIDWKEFNIDNLVDQLLWIKGQVELYDRNHPTHLNVTSPLGGPSGQDVWKEEKIVDILGASIYPAWIFPPEALETHAVLQGRDLLVVAASCQRAGRRRVGFGKP